MSDLEQRLDKEIITEKSLVKKIYNFGSKYIDYKVGLIGAGVMGGIVFGINYYDSQEILGSTTAALKQGSYTFFFGGAVMKGCEYLATKINNKTKHLLYLFWYLF